MRYIHFQKPFSISIHTLREEGDVAQCHDGTAEFPIVKDTTPNITNSRLNNIP